jgi:hypothetical protein
MNIVDVLEHDRQVGLPLFQHMAKPCLPALGARPLARLRWLLFR